MKRIVSLVLSIIMLMSVVTAIPATAQAKSASYTVATLKASKKTLNKKAKKLYLKKISKLKNKGYDVMYCIKDITGDKIVDLILDYHTYLDGSGDTFNIYTYKSGKVKCILKYGQYGMNYLHYYKKSKGLVMYCSGHGHESYTYIKYSGGKFKTVAQRGRMSVNGGNDYNGEWVYYIDKDLTYEATKSEFNAAKKTAIKGSKTNITFKY